MFVYYFHDICLLFFLMAYNYHIIYLLIDKIEITHDIAKKKFEKAMDSLFSVILKNKIYKKIRNIPRIFRITIFLFCLCLFVLEILLMPRFSFGEFALIF